MASSRPYASHLHLNPDRFNETMPAPYLSIFTGQMLFLTPNQHCQSTEGKINEWKNKMQTANIFHSAVLVLDSAASRIAVLQCGTVCPQPCAKTCHWLHLRQNWKRTFSAIHNDSWRPPGAVAAVSQFWRRDISDFTYLLTYWITINAQETEDSLMRSGSRW